MIKEEEKKKEGTRHGLPSSSSDVAPPSSAASKGQGKGMSVSVPQVQDENPIGTATYGAGRLPIYITVWGTRNHNFMTCSSLRRSRLRRSPLCPMCVLNTEEDREAVIYSISWNWRNGPLCSKLSLWEYWTTVFTVWVMPTAGWMNGLSRRNQRLVAKDVEIFTKKCQLPLARVVCWLRTKGVRRFFAVQKEE